MLEKALDGKNYLEGKFTVGDLIMADVLRILDHTDLLGSMQEVQAAVRDPSRIGVSKSEPIPLSPSVVAARRCPPARSHGTRATRISV
jgi:hypothetical protein